MRMFSELKRHYPLTDNDDIDTNEDRDEQICESIDALREEWADLANTPLSRAAVYLLEDEYVCRHAQRLD